MYFLESLKQKYISKHIYIYYIYIHTFHVVIIFLIKFKVYIYILITKNIKIYYWRNRVHVFWKWDSKNGIGIFFRLVEIYIYNFVNEEEGKKEYRFYINNNDDEEDNKLCKLNDGIKDEDAASNSDKKNDKFTNKINNNDVKTFLKNMDPEEWYFVQK